MSSSKIGDTEVIVYESPHMFGYEINIIQHRGDERYLGQIDNEGVMEFMRVERGQRIPHPTLILDASALKAIALAASNLGMRTEEDSYFRGQLNMVSRLLSAMSDHITDLQWFIGKTFREVNNERKSSEGFAKNGTDKHTGEGRKKSVSIPAESSEERPGESR